MHGTADLHTHTIHSDGTLTSVELIKRAKSVGLSAIGITDHDSVNGIDEAIAAGKGDDIVVVPGIEMSTCLNEKEIHILGYFVNHHDQQLLESLEILRHERYKRAERIVKKLNSMNIPLKIEAVLDHAGNGSIGRPHIASAMVDEGHADSYQQAFGKYIGNGRPAYEKKMQCSPLEIIKLIAEAGGLSFLAHPGTYLTEAELIQIIEAGIDGIEVIHPSHDNGLVEYYRGIVNHYYLLESGGSDYHGGMKGDDSLLGQVTVTADAVEAMRRRLYLDAHTE